MVIANSCWTIATRLLKDTSIEPHRRQMELPYHYYSGIAVLACKFHIEISQVAVDDSNAANGLANLEPLEEWAGLTEPFNPFIGAKIEDYATTLLAGLAADFIRQQDARCHIKRTFGDAGLEAKIVRKAWHSLQPEPDRAAAIIVGYLSAYDDGDAEATIRRLFHRAVRILRQPCHFAQLKTMVSCLKVRKRMSGLEVMRELNSELM